MLESGHIIGQVLFNLLIILTPIYFYRWLFNHPHKRKVQIMAGISFGIALIISMVFPIVYGDNGGGYLWDLRWVPYVICVLYIGPFSGAICGILLVAYRFMLGGVIASLNVLLVAIILYTIFLLLRKKYLELKLIEKYLFNLVSSIITFFIVITAVWTHFLYLDKLEIFYSYGFPLYISMGISYIISIFIYTYFTESKLANLRIVEKLHNAEKLNIVSELAASIAHEVRNPLTVVRGFIQLSKVKVDSQLQSYMDTAIHELDRAETIISDYLNFAKPQATSSIEEFNCSKSLNEIILLMQSYANIKGITLKSGIDRYLYTVGDRLKFKQALLNLVKNAIEATDRGSVLLSAQYSKEKGQVVIQVTDTGSGMTQDQLQQLGKPYFSTKSGGTGLGLMVTFRLIESMQGTLKFDSEIGEGTTARINIRGTKKEKNKNFKNGSVTA